MIRALSYWFTGFVLAAISCIVEVKQMISDKPINWFKALLSLAILVSVGLAWWVAAVQEASSAPRAISDKARTMLLSMLRDYAPQKPKIAVYYSNVQESQQYARQWEQVLRDAGWDLIEEREDVPDHQFLAEVYGTEIHVKVLVKSL